MFAETNPEQFQTLCVGVNTNSLSTWLFEAVRQFLGNSRLLLDLVVEDQDYIHRLLRDAAVIGCVSARPKPVQGCKVEYLGGMHYGLFSTPGFAATSFPTGLREESIRTAPAVIFSRKDDLHHILLEKIIGHGPGHIPAHYVPSYREFGEFVTAGLGYGMLPREQSISLTQAGTLDVLAPEHNLPVELYWHCWKHESGMLNAFGAALVENACRIFSP